MDRKAEDHGYSLIIMAIIAVVAIIGLVLMYTSQGALSGSQTKDVAPSAVRCPDNCLKLYGSKDAPGYSRCIESCLFEIEGIGQG